ncbi:hypothetical protein F8S13_23135 [Chloroflexia bacterium SDU3-3]|nr:hypothetical protein F8S13_23135 [Chloroflexia bacterium SDU3-3]
MLYAYGPESVVAERTIVGTTVADAGKAAFRVLDDTLAEGVEHSANKADEAGELIEAVVEQCLRNSFSADTLVTTASGLRPISTIAVGELVLAWDATTRSTGYYPVTAVMLHTDAAQVHLSVGGEHVETTPEHPFYTLERGWVAAGDLWDGAHVRRADGSYALTLVLWLDAEPQVMYNLTVATAHTFFVGVERALVHNAGCPGDALPPYGTKGSKTTGILDTGNESILLESGENGPGMMVPRDTPGMSGAMPNRAHVEGHTAAIMRNENIRLADLYINRMPCSGAYGCMVNLPHMLPEGSILRIHVRAKLSDPWTTLPPFVGISDTLWPPSGLNPKIVLP